MSGHSKWSKVKRFKGALDAKRGALFSKLSREITIAAKIGGGDPDANVRLRSAILSARGQSMPNDNIERAIKRGTGEGVEAQHFDEIVYEGYAPGGVAVIVEAATDNKNRTAAEIRRIFSKNDGNLGDQRQRLLHVSQEGADHRAPERHCRGADFRAGLGSWS